MSTKTESRPLNVFVHKYLKYLKVMHIVYIKQSPMKQITSKGCQSYVPTFELGAMRLMGSKM